MKVKFLFLGVLLLLFPHLLHAEFYQWVDAKGVTHFTDDRDKIPGRYQKRAKKLNLTGEPAQSGAAAPSPGTPAPQPVARPAETPWGNPESWWRQRFSGLRGEQKALLEGLSVKQAKLVELRRKRVIYSRPQDREAINNMQAGISADELRISELQRQIEELEQQASRAAVPREWRQ
jgi:hypothetical protein